MRAAILKILSERIVRNLHRNFYEAIINKEIAFFDERRTGDLISRLNSDTQDTLGTELEKETPSSTQRRSNKICQLTSSEVTSAFVMFKSTIIALIASIAAANDYYDLSSNQSAWKSYGCESLDDTHATCSTHPATRCSI